MNDKIKAFLDRFNEITTECGRFCFASRAKEFQAEACEKLSELRQNASVLKKEMVALNDEDSANAMLCIEYMIDALKNELKMWISLKEDNPNSAWSFLVDAQGTARTAMQAHEVASHLESYIERLLQLEHLLFPPQVFFSPALVIQSARCSICKKEYGECDHLVGKAYMGEMCVREILEIKKLKGVDVVDEPASKHRRVLHFTHDGITRDFLTWRVISDHSPNNTSERKP